MNKEYARIARSLYLIDDNEHPFAGWEFDNRGLAVEKRTAYAQFDFDKVHAQYDTFLTRRFRVQTESTVTLECNFFIDCPDGFTVRLYDEAKKTALSLTTRDGRFFVTDGTSAVPTGIAPLAFSAKNSFKAVIDLKKRVYRAFINNRDTGLHALSEASDGLASMAIGIEKGFTGSLRARGVKMYADYFCNERFLAPFEGEIPCDWHCTTDGTAGMRSSRGYTFTTEDTYYLDIVSGKHTLLEKPLDGARGELCFECKFLEKSASAHTAFLLDSFGLVADNGTLSYADGTPIGTYPRNIWNTLRLELTDAGVLVRLNGKQADARKMAHPDAFRSLRIELTDDTGLALDDILLFGLAPLPADYVPTPVPVKEKGYHVGLHVFSSWRYGFWRGIHDATWDVCSPYDEVTPYMGYYDEGIPEVADWETKWFCEHGIDFQLQCWYGPNVIDEPIKFPGFSHALHDGYFNSVYKECSKFAIMWENNFTSRISPEAFEKYLVPFFIEYYFKDPCYYKIDGRPVFSIYTIETLAKPEYFGSVEKAREEMDFLRRAVKEAGMPDIILMCAGGGASEKGLAFREALGVEGTYAYNWGPDSYTSSFQESCLSNAMEFFAANAHDCVHVPTVGVGFNCVARHDERHPSIPLSEYETILKWTRDVYLTDTRQFPDQNAWQSKMVLLSCWNEFDEGHYINPSGLHGFGFLDTLRRVFCEAPEHVDAKPTEHQKERIDVLYPKGHAWMRPERRLPPPSPSSDAKVVQVWDFADEATCDRFFYQADATGKAWKNGALYGESTGIDPQILLDGDVKLCADEIQFVRVTMTNYSMDGKPRSGGPYLYFATSASPNLSGDKGIACRYTFEPNGDSEALFYCSRNRQWKGDITTFRIDPLSGGGRWEIKKIELLHCKLPNNRVYVDGEAVDIDLPFSVQNGVSFVPLYAKSALMNRLNMAYRWERAAHRVTLLVGETELVFTADSDKALCGGKSLPLPGKVVLIDGVPAVPLAWICGVCGYDCTEDDGVLRITVK